MSIGQAIYNLEGLRRPTLVDPAYSDHLIPKEWGRTHGVWIGKFNQMYDKSERQRKKIREAENKLRTAILSIDDYRRRVENLEEDAKRALRLLKEEQEKKQTVVKQEIIADHLKTQFIDLWSRAHPDGEECVVCISSLHKENIFIAPCGHYLCDVCGFSVDKCVICRKPYNPDAL